MDAVCEFVAKRVRGVCTKFDKTLNAHANLSELVGRWTCAEFSGFAFAVAAIPGRRKTNSVFSRPITSSQGGKEPVHWDQWARNDRVPVAPTGLPLLNPCRIATIFTCLVPPSRQIYQYTIFAEHDNRPPPRDTRVIHVLTRRIPIVCVLEIIVCCY